MLLTDSERQAVLAGRAALEAAAARARISVDATVEDHRTLLYLRALVDDALVLSGLFTYDDVKVAV